MDDIAVKDLMVPLSDYATVSEDATMGDAILALEKAEKEFKSSHPHRAILVMGENNKVVGKLSEFDVIRSLEPKYGELDETRAISRAGISPEFLKSILDKHFLWTVPFRQACRNAAKHKVKDYMYTPSEEEYIEEDVPLREAIHQVVMSHHHSLLVTRGKEILGVLRLSDGFKAVCDEIKVAISEQ